MAAQQPARERAGETTAEFMSRRRREVAASNPASRATAHQAYGQAIRRGEELSLEHPSDVTAHGAHLAREAAKPKSSAPHTTRDWTDVGHPGTVESFVPVWGSAREAVADIHDHKPFSAALNGGLAVLDLSLAGMARKAIAKGGIYAIRGAVGKGAAEANWKRAVRPRLGALGMLKPFQHGHHWLIPQKWEKGTPTLIKKLPVPHAIKNHPLNIKGMPSPEIHGRIHGRYKGKPRFGPIERYQHGTPHWSKALTGSAVGHSATAAHAGKHHQ